MNAQALDNQLWLRDLQSRLTLPLIAAPMFAVSGPELVIAACRAGTIGSFPTSNCRTLEELDSWLTQIRAGIEQQPLDRPAGPVCPNLIIRQARLDGDLECLIRHRVEMVITSVGSPVPVIAPLHEIGCRVFADVASIRHAEKAIAAGVDGLVLLTAGAGGNTGWANAFAFVRAVRRFYEGPVVLAGGVSDGQSLFAARALGCDLAYMGTRFLATQESMAKATYKEAVVAAELDDIITTRAFTGMDSNMLRSSIVANGLDPDKLNETVTASDSRQLFGSGAVGPRRWTDLWSAGHSASGVRDIPGVAELVARITSEYATARELARQIG